MPKLKCSNRQGTLIPWYTIIISLSLPLTYTHRHTQAQAHAYALRTQVHPLKLSGGLGVS